MNNDNIHWFSIINSFVILIFLTAIVVMIFSRILKRDLSQYNAEEADAAEMREETGLVLSLSPSLYLSLSLSLSLYVYTST